MPKHEKIKFEDLEKLGEGGLAPFTEDELLELLNNREKMKLVMQSRKLEFITTMFITMAQSADFKSKVLQAMSQKKESK